MDLQTLKLDHRTVTGKKVKQLRRQGVIPVHLYGAAMGPENLQVDDRTLNRLLLQVGSNIPVSVEYEGQGDEKVCFVREVQRHPVTEEVIHVDFLRVDVSQTVSAEVPLVLDRNIARGVGDGRNAPSERPVAADRGAANEHAG